MTEEMHCFRSKSLKDTTLDTTSRMIISTNLTPPPPPGSPLIWLMCTSLWRLSRWMICYGFKWRLGHGAVFKAP